MSTVSDEAVLESFGYRQELRRSPSFWTSFAYISPVVGLYAIISLATFAAGPAWVWALPIVLVGQLLVASVFAELA
jgi:fatty acid desaturase